MKPSPNSSPPIRILHLEDDSKDSELVQEVLSDAGVVCTYIRVDNKDAFLSTVTKQSFDLIFADYMLPDFDGVKAMQIAKEICPDTPFLFISGTIGEEHAIEMLKTGATDYVLKQRLSRLPPALGRALREAAERSARKQAEEALRDREQKYRSLVANVPGIIWAANEEGVVTFVGSHIFEMLGYHEEQLCGAETIWDQIVHPHDKQLLNSAYSSLFHEGGSYDLEYRVYTQSGEIQWVHDRAVLITKDDGTKEAYGFMSNVTDQKMAEHRLEMQCSISKILAEAPEREQAGTRILQTVCEGLNWDMAEIWLVQEERPVLQCLSVWETASTPDMEEYLSIQPEREIPIDGDLGFLLLRNRQHLFIPDLVSETRFPELHPQKQLGFRSVFGFPLILQEDLLGLILFFNRRVRTADQTLLQLMETSASQICQFIKRKKLEEAGKELEMQLRQSQKIEAIGQLAGGIAHDFNNILMAISSYCELIHLKLQDDQSEIVPNVREIAAAADKGATLTKQLLAFSRKQVLEAKIVDLNRILRSSESMLQRLIGENIEIRLKLDPQIGLIKADPGQIEQILLNLAVNARDAIVANGTIRIETSRAEVTPEFAGFHPGMKAGSYSVLSIADDGHGMSEQVQSKIFEPFFTTKPKGKGTGLGLSTVYGIVKQSDGYVSVQSKQGAGTTFRIYLPTTSEAEEQERFSPVRTERKSANETILLVDDNESVRTAVGSLLQLLGYTVIEAANGQEALGKAEQMKDGIHLIITDFLMPNMSGQDLVEELRKTRPNLPVIFISGFTEEAVRLQGKLLPDCVFLQKPVHMKELHQRVRALLSQSSTPRNEL